MLGGTALEAAAFNGNIDNLKLLLDRGAKLNCKAVDTFVSCQSSALHRAVEVRQKATVKLLLDRGAKASSIGALGSILVTAMIYRQDGGSENILRLLLDSRADVNAESYDGSALQNAVSYGNENFVRLLLDREADVNARGSPYALPFGHALHRAIKGRKDIALVKLLIDKGADVNLRSIGPYFKSHSTIAAAASIGSEDIVKLLLDREANVNADCDYWGNTLRAAAFSGNESIVRLVLEKRAEDNANSDIDTFL